MRDALLQVTYPAVGSNTPTPIIHVERLDINSTSKEGVQDVHTAVACEQSLLLFLSRRRPCSQARICPGGMCTREICLYYLVCQKPLMPTVV